MSNSTSTLVSAARKDTCRCAETMVHRLDAAFARVWTLDKTGDVLVLKEKKESPFRLRTSLGDYLCLTAPHIWWVCTGR